MYVLSVLMELGEGIQDVHDRSSDEACCDDVGNDPLAVVAWLAAEEEDVRQELVSVVDEAQ